MVGELISRVWRRLRRTWNPPLTKAIRHANPYATHLPVLVAIARVWRIDSVLELGSGHYSSLTFLDRSCFPDLKRLVSWENDRTWFEEMKPVIGADSRAEYRFIAGPIAAGLDRESITSATLILIDDSTTATDRAATIARVAELARPETLVLVHDFETAEYLTAAELYPQRYVFEAFMPQTGLLSLGRTFPMRRLQRLDRSIRRASEIVAPNDLAAWTRIH